MKKKQHPKQYTLSIIMTDGSTFQKKSILPEKTLKLEIDAKTHASWDVSKLTHSIEFEAEQVLKFKRKFIIN